MLIGILGALVKELPQNLGLSTDTLELVLSTPQKHKKVYFHFKISFLSFLNQCPGDNGLQDPYLKSHERQLNVAKPTIVGFLSN